MDARQYLAKKGIELDREEEKPHTLEELAWSRAREAGQHRPRSGTPHDWEDWSRYHDALADGADQLEQKIDPTAHGAAARADASGDSGDKVGEKAKVDDDVTTGDKK